MINKIFKPKSKKDIIREIRKMNSYEFVFYFKNRKVFFKYWGLGFKKYFLLFCVKTKKISFFIYFILIIIDVLIILFQIEIFLYIFLFSFLLTLIFVPFLLMYVIVDFIIDKKQIDLKLYEYI